MYVADILPVPVCQRPEDLLLHERRAAWEILVRNLERYLRPDGEVLEPPGCLLDAGERRSRTSSRSASGFSATSENPRLAVGDLGGVCSGIKPRSLGIWENRRARWGWDGRRSRTRCPDGSSGDRDCSREGRPGSFRLPAATAATASSGHVGRSLPSSRFIPFYSMPNSMFPPYHKVNCLGKKPAFSGRKTKFYYR
jgi:hypothetical protein